MDSPIPASIRKWPPRWFVLLFLALTMMSLFPLTLSSPLPLADFQNHMARIHIIANIDRSEALARYFTVEWRLLPDLAMDIIVPPMARLVSTDTASKLFIVLIMVMTITSVVALHKTLFEKWSAFPLVVFLFIYHRTFIWGFASYLFTVALSLWILVAWIRLRHCSAAIRIPVFTLLTSCLYPLHFHALAIYATLLGTFEISKALEARGVQGYRAVGPLLLNAVPFVPALLLISFSPTASEVDLRWGDVRNKLIGLLDPFNLYNLPLDIATFILIGGLFVVGLLTRRLVIHRSMALGLSVLSALYFALPEAIFGSNGADRRLWPVVLIVLCASVDWRARSVHWRLGLASVLIALFAVRIGVIAMHWSNAGMVYRDIRQAIAMVGRGERMAVAVARLREPTLGDPPLHHIAAMAVIDREAFVNSLFVDPRHQILKVRYEIDPAFRGCCSDEFMVPNRSDSNGPPVSPVNPFETIPLKSFDHILLIGLQWLPYAAPPGLTEIYRGADFALFRIHPPPAGAAGPA